MRTHSRAAYTRITVILFVFLCSIVANLLAAISARGGGETSGDEEGRDVKKENKSKDGAHQDTVMLCRKEGSVRSVNTECHFNTWAKSLWSISTYHGRAKLISCSHK